MTTSETPDTGYLPPMLNPFEPGFFEDPYAQYALVRDQDPVHLSPLGYSLLSKRLESELNRTLLGSGP